MSQKVFPIFDKKREKKQLQQRIDEDDDCVVYLGEDLIVDSKKTDSVPIKQEAIDQMNESTSEIFQLYSQEQDSIIDDESVFHNSFAKIEESSKAVEEDDDDDEDIKLIYDSRDLIEQICRKYDTIETKKEKTASDDHSPIVVKQKSEPHEIIVEENSNDSSDMDILLCSAADEYEKNNPTPLKPSSKSNETKKSIESVENFKTLKDCLFGDDLDSLSSDEESTKNDKIKLSTRTPDHTKTNSSTKRTISTDYIEKSKKQRLNSNEESLFYIERPPIDPKKCQIRRPLFPNASKKTIEITSKKNVDLLLNKKFKPNTNAGRDLSFSLTQSMNLARQENRMREKARIERVIEEKKKTEPAKQIVQNTKEIKKIIPKENSDVVGSILNQMNVQHKNKAEKKTSSCFIFENFLFRILKWSYNWLEEQNKFSCEMKKAVPPPVVDNQELEPLIDSYLSYEDYYKTMFPLLLAETWEEIFNEWKDSKRHEVKTYQNSSICLKSVDKVAKHQELMELTFQSMIKKTILLVFFFSIIFSFNGLGT